MPVYEYYCQTCDGIFEELRPMRESSEPVPCPQCFKDAGRIMPTSFSAFVFREGYPRRIPDDGQYYHLGKKVTKLVKRGRPNEHPEVNKRAPKPKPLKGDLIETAEMRQAARKGELTDMYGGAVSPAEVQDGVAQGRVYKQGTPKRGLSKLPKNLTS
ncbi:MAG TPA: zinc ribbon domain-containing protein [Tepidiformaceae bacterium]|nr:zinc ribbon domain-containing protein [Tepidiformaceae bacterium]